jgi:hypothetical protein
MTMLWGSLAGGAIGTVVLSAGLRTAQELGLTRMDLALLLGTVFSGRRGPASVIGYALHFCAGLVFALLYAAVFYAVGHAGWALGLALGAVHALFFGGTILDTLLPAVHPRMGTPWTDSEETPLLEYPGFLLANYGRATVLVHLALHLAYGAIVGAFAAGL